MIPSSHLPVTSTARGAGPTEAELQGWIDRIMPGGTLLCSWPLTGGSSAGMTAFAVDWPGEGTQTLVLRQLSNPRAGEREFKTLLTLESLQLPAPLPRLLDPPFLITSFTEGAMDFSLASAERIAGEMAACLVKLHTADLAKVNLHFLPDINERLAREIKTADYPPNEWMQEAHIRRALTAALPLKTRNPMTLLHGDFWPGNLLWQNGNLAAVIDWEDAALGDPLADLAITRLDLRWIFGSAAMQIFTAKYLGRVKIDLIDLPLWDIYAALRFIRLAGNDLSGWAAYFPPFGRLDIAAETILRDYHDFVELALRQVKSTTID